jgi:hypothetical protein
MSEIIQTHRIVFKPGYAHDGRRPQVTMNQLERFGSLDKELEKDKQV